jgi:hypothetical protein
MEEDVTGLMEATKDWSKQNPERTTAKEAR